MSLRKYGMPALSPPGLSQGPSITAPGAAAPGWARRLVRGREHHWEQAGSGDCVKFNARARTAALVKPLRRWAKLAIATHDQIWRVRRTVAPIRSNTARSCGLFGLALPCPLFGQGAIRPHQPVQSTFSAGCRWSVIAAVHTGLARPASGRRDHGEYQAACAPWPHVSP